MTTKTITHEMFSGETMTFEATAEEAAFYERAARLAADPAVTSAALVGLCFGPENPLRKLHPSGAALTKASIKQPLHAALFDLVQRQWTADGLVEAEADDPAQRYSLTVADAAESLGLSVQAVRQAIRKGRLVAVKRGGQYWITPASVDLFRPSRRGPGHKVEVIRGHKQGVTMRTRHDGQDVDLPRKPGMPSKSWRGLVSGWSRMAVMTSLGDRYRLHLISAGGDDTDRIGVGPFHVDGRFTRVYVSESRDIHKLWRDPELLGATFEALAADEATESEADDVDLARAAG